MTARLIGYAMLVVLAAGLMGGPPAAAQMDERTRAFNAPVDRVWIVTRSTLESLGWDIDKEDRDVGWLVTDSRRLDGDNYGVYSKGTKHRLRLVIKGLPAGVTQVTVERRVFKQERILFVDKEEDVPTTDRTVEKRVLDAIQRSL